MTVFQTTLRAVLHKFEIDGWCFSTLLSKTPTLVFRSTSACTASRSTSLIRTLLWCETSSAHEFPFTASMTSRYVWLCHLSIRPVTGDCLAVKREYHQNSSLLDCVTQCSSVDQRLISLIKCLVQLTQVTFHCLHRQVRMWYSNTVTSAAVFCFMLLYCWRCRDLWSTDTPVTRRSSRSCQRTRTKTFLEMEEFYVLALTSGRNCWVFFRPILRYSCTEVMLSLCESVCLSVCLSCLVSYVW